MSKDNWKEAPPKAMTEQELIDKAGDYLFECLVSHGASMDEIIAGVSERVTVCLNGFHEAIDEQQAKKEDH